MVEYQWLRPGGAVPIPLPGDMPPDQKNTIRRDAFLTFLKQSGHPGEVGHAQAEFEAAHSARAILDKSADPEYTPPTRQAKNLTGWWIAGNLLLVNAAEMFLLGIIAVALARRKRRMAPMLGERRDNPLNAALRAAANASKTRAHLPINSLRRTIRRSYRGRVLVTSRTQWHLAMR